MVGHTCTSSVNNSSSTSAGLITPYMARLFQLITDFQYCFPISTTGKERWTLPVCFRVRSSNNSSQVPKPPGATTRAWEEEERERETRRERDALADRQAAVGGWQSAGGRRVCGEAVGSVWLAPAYGRPSRTTDGTGKAYGEVKTQPVMDGDSAFEHVFSL